MFGRISKIIELAKSATDILLKSNSSIRTITSHRNYLQKLDGTETTEDTLKSPHTLPSPITEPLITSRDVPSRELIDTPQAWLETLANIEDSKLGLIDLHPDIFATKPRLDILHQNVRWQQMYTRINFDIAESRAEKSGGGRKPWRQKGTGRARHGSIRSPLWKGGGKSHGPRGPKSYWYVLPVKLRVMGLRVALSVKHAQDDLHIVDSLQLPSPESEYLVDLAKERCWGSSILFVDNKPVEDLPENFLEAVNGVKSYNVLSMEGLNVYSMLKHETLVLTLDVVEDLEKQLCYHLHSFTTKQQQQYETIIKSQLRD